jgi:ketosteroid isomerase-like protein
MKKLALVAAMGTLVLSSPAFAGAVEEMLDTDSAFAAMAQSDNVPAAFAAYAAEDVHMYPDGSDHFQGRDAMIESFADWPDGATLEWTPVEGMAASSGDLGFTWGRYVLTLPGEDGENTVKHGKYVSVWRKGDDGWKFVVDIGNSSPSPGADN